MMSSHPACFADQWLSIMQCVVKLRACRYIDERYVVGTRDLLCFSLLMRY